VIHLKRYSQIFEEESIEYGKGGTCRETQMTKRKMQKEAIRSIG